MSTRSPIIDVDSHFQEPLDWLERIDADAAEAATPSDVFASFADAVVGEISSSMPGDAADNAARFLPPFAREFAKQFEGMTATEIQQRIADSPLADLLATPGGLDPVQRLAHLDDEGIDHQIVNPGLGLVTLNRIRRHAPQYTQRAMAAYNTFAADAVDGHTSRLWPTTVVDLSDPDWSTAELNRMRARGSRSFLIYPIEPVAGKSLAHVDLDPIWHVAAEMGMAAIMHVGAGNVKLDPGWANTGREELGDVAFLAWSQISQIPQVGLTAMIAGGVFERHPELIVIVEEFGIEWVPGWLRWIENIVDVDVIRMMMGGWNLPAKPSDYVRRNVRISPLRGQPVDVVLDELDDTILVFGSDFPHPEGSRTAVSDFASVLASADAETNADFFGATMARSLGLATTT